MASQLAKRHLIIAIAILVGIIVLLLGSPSSGSAPSKLPVVLGEGGAGATAVVATVAEVLPSSSTPPRHQVRKPSSVSPEGDDGGDDEERSPSHSFNGRGASPLKSIVVSDVVNNNFGSGMSSTEVRAKDNLNDPYYARIIPTAEDKAVEAANNAAMAKGGAYYFRWLADNKDMPITPWKPGRANPITCPGHGDYYSGHFSIPPENMLSLATFDQQIAEGKRFRDWSGVIPYVPATYTFKTEETYRQNMEEAKFGVSRRKLGFATMRNLELQAAGAIPYFCAAHLIPKTGTLASLPLGFYRMVNQWPGVGMRCYPKKKSRVFPIDTNVFNVTQYNIAARKLLEWTHIHQRTDYHALYVLSATSLTALPKNVLVIWASHYTILLTTIIHGLASLGVPNIVDVPRRGDTYKGQECEENKHKTYAKGWFFFCRVEESKGISRDNIEERIKAKSFDLIIISITDTLTYHMKDPRTEVPYFDAITANYPRDRVLTINDADLIRPMQHDVAHKFMHNMSIYFKRETHGCNEDIMYKKM